MSLPIKHLSEENKTKSVESAYEILWPQCSVNRSVQGGREGIDELGIIKQMPLLRQQVSLTEWPKGRRTRTRVGREWEWMDCLMAGWPNELGFGLANNQQASIIPNASFSVACGWEQGRLNAAHLNKCQTVVCTLSAKVENSFYTLFIFLLTIKMTSSIIHYHLLQRF